MQRKERRIGPRLLTLGEAALYCGISVPSFRNLSPVRPIALGPGPKLQRYDRQILDEWIDDLGKGQPAKVDWLAELDRNNDRTQG